MQPTYINELKITIKWYFNLHKSKGKNHTYNQYKKCGLGRATIFRWLDQIEKEGSVTHRPGQGRPSKIGPGRRLMAAVNHKTGVSQRKLARKFQVYMLQMEFIANRSQYCIRGLINLGTDLSLVS